MVCSNYLLLHEAIRVSTQQKTKTTEKRGRIYGHEVYVKAFRRRR